MKKIVVFCLLILASELSGQNFQRSYKSANEDPDLLNMVLLTSGNLIASGTSDFQLQPVLVGLSPQGKRIKIELYFAYTRHLRRTFSFYDSY